MRPTHIHLIAGILALGPAFAWPARSDAALPVSADLGPRTVVERALPKDAFRDFLLENRAREDSLHYQQGEAALGREEFALALSHHLAADLPAAGNFRDDLLAQRSRIFARLWPSAASPDSKDKGPADDKGRQKPAFEWGTGVDHSRGMDRTGPLFPYGRDGSGSESGDWRSKTYARRSWPLALGKQALDLGLSAQADRSSLGGASDYEAALEAEMPDGILENLFLSLSAGLGQARDWGSYRYYGLLASKTWYSKRADAGFEAGYSGQWEGGWKRLNDNAWAKASRDIPIAGGESIHASLEIAATRQASPAERYVVPVLYVDDVARARPSLYQGPASPDTLPGEGPDSFSRYPAATGERTLTLGAPRAYLSFSPAFDYAFALPAGFRARAGAWYSLDIYAEYAQDRIPWPDTLDPYAGGLAGLALNRADGRYYPAILTEQDGKSRAYFGTAPLEQVKTRRVDNRTGLDFNLGKDLPGGFSLSLESSLELGWTNLARTSSSPFRPWQWGLGLSVSRASI